MVGLVECYRIKLTSSDLFLVGDFSVQITSISVVHHDTETPLIHEGFFVSDDVWVTHSFENVDLKKNRFIEAQSNSLSTNMALLL